MLQVLNLPHLRLLFDLENSLGYTTLSISWCVVKHTLYMGWSIYRSRCYHSLRVYSWLLALLHFAYTWTSSPLYRSFGLYNRSLLYPSIQAWGSSGSVDRQRRKYSRRFRSDPSFMDGTCEDHRLSPRSSHGILYLIAEPWTVKCTRVELSAVRGDSGHTVFLLCVRRTQWLVADSVEARPI